MTIQILDSSVADKIAAGEVVERPASIVKELVENAIDADAREVSIDISGGGKKSIVVIDDGVGMSPEDLKLSILRHATSKISSADDLFAINTLGFRGEALPSVAAVSRLSIETKLREGTSAAGAKITVEGSRVVEFGEVGAPEGTKIEVKDLFFNTPARQKFLKSDPTEFGHIYDTCVRLALGFSDVRLTLRKEGREELRCTTSGDLKGRLFEVFGKDVADQCHYMEEESTGIKISGWIGAPSLARRSASGIYWFVNRRWIRDRRLNHAIFEGYGNLIPRGEFPFVVLFLDIDPTMVDVNVHPTKEEVRFAQGQAVHQFVKYSLRKHLEGEQRSVSVNSLQQTVEPREYPGNVEVTPQMRDALYSDLNPAFDPPARHRTSTPLNERNVELLHHEQLTLNDRGRFSALKPIGQFRGTYVVCEAEEGHLVVVDQHAAHERIGFEQLKKQIQEGGVLKQNLLLPETVELTPREHSLVIENCELLQRAGLDVDDFGGRSVVVKAIPAILGDVNPATILRNVADELAEFDSSASLDDKIEHILKTVACHKQIRAHHHLSIPEMSALLREMDRHPNSDRCPHGRPSFVEFPEEEVSRWFKRT